MNILIYPHAMELGGSQLNAVELAGALDRRGHRVTVVGESGPLVDLVHDLGLEHVQLPIGRRPSLSAAAALRREAVRRRADIVHGFEWPPALESWTAFATRRRPLAVATVMSMSIAPFLPPDLPLTVGTPQLVDVARAQGCRLVYLLEPMVDTKANAPGFPVRQFRQRVPEIPGMPDVVVVSRLANELKLSGLIEAVDAVSLLPPDHLARLVVVGDGPARGILQRHIDDVNARSGRAIAVLAGEMSDPRSAYAAATVTLGMGSSALRAMALGKPLVVQGERGFWQPAEPGRVDPFLQSGWFGIGDGDGVLRLRDHLVDLLSDAARRSELERFGRDLVEQRFSLAGAAGALEEWYTDLLRAPRGAPERLSQAIASVPSIGQLVRYKARRFHQKRLGTAPRDDFNAVTPPPSTPPAGQATDVVTLSVRRSGTRGVR